MVFTPQQCAFILMAYFRIEGRNAGGMWVYSLWPCFAQFSEEPSEPNIDYETFGHYKRFVVKRF